MNDRAQKCVKRLIAHINITETAFITIRIKPVIRVQWKRKSPQWNF